MTSTNADLVPSTHEQRFCVQLFIVHPTIAPTEITDTFGFEPKYARQVGQPRRTPNGTALPGLYPDTRWRYSIEYETNDQWFAAAVEAFVIRLEPCKAFLKQLFATGGRGTVIIQFLGDDGHFGDELSPSILIKLADLGLSLGVEVYTVPQSS
jgi:hypothetical protein